MAEEEVSSIDNRPLLDISEDTLLRQQNISFFEATSTATPKVRFQKLSYESINLEMVAINVPLSPIRSDKLLGDKDADSSKKVADKPLQRTSQLVRDEKTGIKDSKTSVAVGQESDFKLSDVSEVNQQIPPKTKHQLIDLQFKEEQIMRRFGGVFNCHEKRHVFSKKSLCCLSDQNMVRKGSVWLITWSWFDTFVILAIILNSLLLATTDYGTRLNTGYVSEWTPTQDKIDMVFSFIFLFEATCKIIAMGFAVHDQAYLSDAWNCLDFFIVVVSVVTMLPLGGNQDAIKSLRTFRILRPLRSINKMPKMRLQIQSLMQSIPGLMRVFMFIIFIFTIFSIFGTITFNGLQYKFCRATEEAEFDKDGNFFEWRKLGDDGDGPVLCDTDQNCATAFPENSVAICGTVYEKYGLDPIQFDNVRNIELIMYGIPGFDNVFQAFLTVFQILTLESWVYLMYNYSDTGSSAISIIFFVLIVIIGAFFTMNLILAIIVDAFNESQDEFNAQVKKIEEEAKEEAARSSKKLEMESGKKIEEVYDVVNKADDKRKEKDGTYLPPDQTYQQDETNKELDGQQLKKEEEKVYLHTQYEEEWYEQDARGRSYEKGAIYRLLYVIVTSVSFNFFIFLLILGNTVTLAAYTYDQSDEQEKLLAIFNNFFTWIFFVEMVMKIIGLGFYNYRQEFYNLFDAIIVLLSVIDWSLSQTSLDLGPILKALRALRLLRMLKLAKSWTALAEIMRKMGQSMVDISNFSLLLILFMYIFALLGMELFSNVAMIDEEDNLVIGQNYIQELYLSDEYSVFPRDNFNNIGFALTTVFIAIIGEDWNWTMYQWVRAYGNGSDVSYRIALFYFIVLMILGNIVLLSLFTAILLRNFEGETQDDDDDKIEEEEDLDDKSKLEEKPQPSMCSKKSRDKLFLDFQYAFGKKKIKLQAQEDPKIQQNMNSNIEGDAQQVGGSDKELKDPNIEFDVDEQDELAQLQRRVKENRQKNAKIEKEKIMKQRQERYDKASSLIHYDVHAIRVIKEEKLDELQVDTTSVAAAIQEEELPELVGQSLYCCGPDSPFRNLCHITTNSKWFKTTILIAILFSTITLALDSPLKDPESNYMRKLAYIDLVMTCIFTFEVALKVIAVGFFFNGPDSFIRDSWNILDFIIVASALLSTVLGESVPFLKSLRILRVLRPLRVISRNKGLKVAIISLGRSMPNIARLQIMVIFFVFLFAILNTILFSGSFNFCSTDHLVLSMKQKNQSIQTMWDCYNYGGEWIVPDLNFDTTMTSLLTLVTIQTTEGWIDVMWSSVDSVQPYYQPIENSNPIMIVYFMILVVIICLLFIELFVGVIIETFSNQKEFVSGNRSLHRIQRSWIEVHMMTQDAEPRKKFEMGGNSQLRDFCIAITLQKYFDPFIMICIMLNTFILGFDWYMQSVIYDKPLDKFNNIFLIIFTLEAIIKILALKLIYFQDPWNRFDFTIVSLTISILVVNWAIDVNDLAIIGIILRTLRTCRIFRLIKKQEKLLAIFQTLVTASPAMGSLGLLLMLLIFMFSIIGMSFFALVNLDGASEMGPHTNFQTFGNSFLTLLRCATGEAWNSIMFDSSQSPSILYSCNQDEDYHSIVADGRDPTDTYGPQGCGSGAAVGFHLFFQIIVSQVFLNLFIAIIIDAFFGQSDLAQLPVKPKTIEDFIRHWSIYDKQASGYITIAQSEDLLKDLAQAEDDEGGSLIQEKEKVIKELAFRQRYIAHLEIPTYDGMQKVMFYDVLMKLVHQTIKVFYKKDQIEETRRNLAVISKLGGQNRADELEAINQNSSNNLHTYDKQFIGLLKQMDRKNPKAELIKEIKISNQEFRSKYNHLVDTNIKIIGQEKFAQMQKDNLTQIELQTTLHYGSAVEIYNFIVSSIDRRKEERDSLMTSFDSAIENQDSRTVAVLDDPNMPSYAGNFQVGEVQHEPELNSYYEQSVVNGLDEDWANRQ